jgi:site-specific DNA recombinase
MKAAPQVSPVHKPVGIWIRVSTEDQAQGESPQHHEQRGRFYAQAKGWEVKEVYDLAGVSGKSVMDHPEAKRMLADIRRGHITGLIFSKLARLARNTKELLEFSEIFRQHNADLISLQESIDTSTPAGRLFYTMIAAMAQWEREEIADRVKASVAIRAKMGKPLNTSSPYGYRWKNRELLLVPDEAAVRKRAYELFLEHRRKVTVARILNDAGHRTRRGQKWSDIGLRRILTDPSAKGVYYYNTHKSLGGWDREPKPQEQWGTLQVEPIVSEDLWNQVNTILEEQHKPSKRPGKKPVQLFAGLAYCSCGNKMYVPSHTPKYICFKCRNKIPVVDLEAIYYDELKAFFVAPERIASLIQAANHNLAEKQTLMATQQGEIRKVKDEMTRTHKLYLEGQVPLERFGEFYKPLEERLKQLQDSVVKLQAELDYAKVNTVSAEEVLTEAEALYARWPKLPIENKRKVVEAITEKIVIGKGEIDITLAYLPSSEEMAKTQQRLAMNASSECEALLIWLWFVNEESFLPSRKFLSPALRPTIRFDSASEPTSL